MIVHGESIKDKHKVVQIREDVKIESIQLAIQLLQYLIMAISKNATFLKASAIDEYFMEHYEKLQTSISEDNIDKQND